MERPPTWHGHGQTTEQASGFTNSPETGRQFFFVMGLHDHVCAREKGRCCTRATNGSCWRFWGEKRTLTTDACCLCKFPSVKHSKPEMLDHLCDRRGEKKERGGSARDRSGNVSLLIVRTALRMKPHEEWRRWGSGLAKSSGMPGRVLEILEFLVEVYFFMDHSVSIALPNLVLPSHDGIAIAIRSLQWDLFDSLE